MSEQLRLNAVVTADATNFVAGARTAAAATSDVKVALLDAERNAKTAAAALNAHEAASRAAGLAGQDLARAVRDSAKALVEAQNEVQAQKSALAQLEAQARKTAAAHTAHGAAVGTSAQFSRVQLLELGHVGKSVFDQLAAGASPVRALTLEGGRLAEIVAGSGGVKGALTALIGLAGGPLVVGLGLGAVAVAGLGYEMAKASNDAENYQTKLDFTGNAAGLTRGRFEELAQSVAAASHKTIAAADDIAQHLVDGGLRSRTEIDQVAVSTLKLADFTGQSATKIADEFLKAQAAPGKYAAEFARQYGTLTAVQIEHIAQLEREKGASAAASELFADIYTGLVDKAPGQLNLLSRIYTNFIADVSAKAHFVSSLFAPSTDEQNLVKAQAQLKNYANDPTANNPERVAQLQAQIAGLQAKIAAANAKADAQAAAAQTRDEGVDASKRIAEHWGKVGDNIRGANIEIAKFRADVAAALKANPNDATALDAKSRAAAIEADIRKKFTPEASSEARKAAEKEAAEQKAAAKRESDLAANIAKIEEQSAAVLQVGSAREAELKIIELEHQALRKLTDTEKERVTYAIQNKELAEGLAKELAANSNIRLTQPELQKNADAARDKERADPSSLASLSETLSVNFADKAAKAGQDFSDNVKRGGDAFASLIGSSLPPAIARGLSSIERNAGKPGGNTAIADTLSKFGEGYTNFNNKTFGAITGKLDTIFGTKGGAFAETAGKAFAGASQGQLAGGVLKSLGVKTSNTGSEIGGAIGSLIPALGPFGGLIGGAIGGILGGLLKPKPYATAVVSSGNVTAGASSSSSLEKAAVAGGNSIATGIQSIVDQLGGDLGTYKVSIGKYKDDFRISTTGYSGKLGGDDARNAREGVQSFSTEEEAISAAIADAIKDGAVAGVSPKVEAALQKYSSDVNKALSEAFKVKNLEDILANEDNPFATIFRDFELQAKQRLQVAKDNGFDIVQIEKINGEQRAKLIAQQLANATSSLKNTLNDLQFGSRATGSAEERRVKLQAEEDRLVGLIKGGDTGQYDALSNVAQQLVDLEKETYGSTRSTERDAQTSLLQDLISSVTDQVNAASKAAQDAQQAAVDKLTEANSTLDTSATTLTQIRDILASGVSYSGGLALASVANRYLRPV